MLCQNCKAEFQSVRYDAKYCSPKCRTASHRKAKRPELDAFWFGDVVKMSPERQAIAERAQEIVEAYSGAVTVRQIYYRLVASNVIPNTEQSYNRVKEIIGNARKSGLIPWDKVEDRNREIVKPAVWASPTEFKSDVRHWYDEDRWQLQPRRVAVVIEKKALAGLVQPICRRWQVPFVAASGYGSLTLMKDAAQAFDGYHILYAGDHDPSGKDMADDWQKRLLAFRCFAVVRPIALTKEQIDQYSLPPQPMKSSDSRSEKYLAEHGEQTVWELDALPPDDLQRIVDDAIREYVDMEKWLRMNAQIEERRAKI